MKPFIILDELLQKRGIYFAVRISNPCGNYPASKLAMHARYMQARLLWIASVYNLDQTYTVGELKFRQFIEDYPRAQKLLMPTRGFPS
jgi:hypothetical protein